LSTLQVLLYVFQHGLAVFKPLFQIMHSASIIQCDAKMSWFVTI
jgi:hypothetical protein